MSIFSRIEREIYTLHKPAVVGVNGVDTSGKSTFALGLAEFLREKNIPVVVLHMDDFHNPRAVRYQDESPEGYVNFAFDLAKLNSVIQDLKKTGTIEIDLLDLDSDMFTIKKKHEATAETVIIVEGTLLYRHPLDKLFDYKIFLHITFDEVIRRAKERDVPKYGEEFLLKYTNRYIPAQKLYLSRHSPIENCQLIIDNNDYEKPFPIAFGYAPALTRI
jgi:phosphoglycolate phosphatase